MKKNVTNKKEIVPTQNNSLTTRVQNKKMAHNMINSSIFPSKHDNYQKSSKQNLNKGINENNIIYDQEFISYINNLSDIIKVLYKSNHANFSVMKNLLENNNLKADQNEIKLDEDKNTIKTTSENNNDKINIQNNNDYANNINSINTSFNNIESSFNSFYSNAIVLFKKMKSYKEAAENKKTLLKLNNKSGVTDLKKNINSSSSSPKKNLFEFNKKNPKETININTKNNNINENFDNSIDKIKKIETENNNFNENYTKSMENFEINVTRKNNNKKVYKKTPSKDLKSNRNTKTIKKPEVDFTSVVQENKLLKEKNLQLEKKNKNLLEMLQANNNSNPNNDDINTNLSINDILNMNNHSNQRNNKAKEINSDLYDKSNNSQNSSFLFNSVNSTKNIYNEKIFQNINKNETTDNSKLKVNISEYNPSKTVTNKFYTKNNNLSSSHHSLTKNRNNIKNKNKKGEKTNPINNTERNKSLRFLTKDNLKEPYKKSKNNNNINNNKR